MDERVKFVSLLLEGEKMADICRKFGISRKTGYKIWSRYQECGLSTVFAGQAVGLKEVNDKVWLVSFLDYDLGYFDEDSRKFEPLDNPFGSKLCQTVKL